MRLSLYRIPATCNQRHASCLGFQSSAFAVLIKLVGIPYTVDMAPITELHPAADDTRASRAAFVRDSLKSERWSIRHAASELGMSHTALSTRVRGATPFLADELEAIARFLLKRDPIEFYAEYLAAGQPPADTKNAPFPKEGGVSEWAQRGSNPRPAD